MPARRIRGARPPASPLGLRPPTRAVAGSDEPQQEFARWVLRQAGIRPDCYRGQPLQRRVHACLRALKAASPAAAQALLLRRPELLHGAVDTLLIGVTDFFRDRSVFDDIRTKVIPTLAARSSRIRVWSAGCSSGEELYSVGILLADAGVLERTMLLGTDCRVDAIGEARTSIYSTSAAACLPPAARDAYFEATSLGWRPSPGLRERAQWKVSDASREIEPGPWDVILWRNAAIYLEPAAAGRVAARLATALRQGGYLIVGKAERVPPTTGMLPVSCCIYRRDGPPHVCE